MFISLKSRNNDWNFENSWKILTLVIRVTSDGLTMTNKLKQFRFFRTQNGLYEQTLWNKTYVFSLWQLHTSSDFLYNIIVSITLKHWVQHFEELNAAHVTVKKDAKSHNLQKGFLYSCESKDQMPQYHSVI